MPYYKFEKQQTNIKWVVMPSRCFLTQSRSHNKVDRCEMVVMVEGVMSVNSEHVYDLKSPPNQT